MAFNANFKRVNVLEDGALEVVGESLPSDGTDKILVSLVHGADMRSQPVKDPKLKPWTVDFADDVSPFAIGDEVFVVGVAHRVGHDPFVWQGSFEILAKDSP
jgi:hypothetical protein